MKPHLPEISTFRKGDFTGLGRSTRKAKALGEHQSAISRLVGIRYNQSGSRIAARLLTGKTYYMSENNRAVELCKKVQSVMNRKRWLGAIKLLKDNLSVVQKDWELSWNLAWCYRNCDRLDEARTHMIRAAKLAPKNAICRFGLGVVYLEMKQFKKAEANCAESLRIKDAYVPRLTLALAYIEQGKLADAENVHLEGIKLKPKESRRYESYADFLSDVGREEQARAMYRKAKKLDRKSPATSRGTVPAQPVDATLF